MTEQLALDLDKTVGGKDRAKVAKVLASIRRHAGRASAIAPATVASETGVSYRDVQAIVKFLVEERAWPIGTATAKPFGYYVIRTEKELRENYRHFVRRGVSNLKHARAYNKPSLAGPIVGQQDLNDILEQLEREAAAAKESA